MSSPRLDEEEIFHIARTMEDGAIRSKYLDQICAGDQPLRDRVEALVQVHEQEKEFLQSKSVPKPTVDLAPISEAPDQRISRYKLLQKIGEGGFGVVYMAEQQRPVRRKVALKIIKPGMDTRAVVARFEAERQALALMDHTNIARVFDGGSTDSGKPYFVMELVKGVPITEYCDANHLSTQDRLGLFITVCQAVQHAHQKGIIHRDLKPFNILVTLHDGQPVVKVIDFGVAKAINQQLTEKTLFTAFGQMVGTPQYMSPEQAEMSGLDVDTRSDVYSLGVLLYELLTGATPLESERFRTAGYAEIQRIIREEEPPKPSTRLSTSGEKLTIVAKHRGVSPERLHRTIRGDLDWIVMKALDKDRARRYETASGFSDDIRRHLGGEPVVACPPSTIYQFTKFTRRNKTGIAVATVIVALLGIGMVNTLWQKQRVESALRDAEIARGKANRVAKQLTETIVDLQESLFNQGVVYALSGDFDSAKHAIESLEQANSGSLARQLQAVVYLEEGKAREVVKLLEPEAKKDPNSVIVRALLTLAYDGAGNIDMWFQSHKVLKTLEPKTAEDHMFAAIAYILDPEKAVHFASIAFDQRKSPSMLLTRGRSQADWAMQAGKPELTERAINDVNMARGLLGHSGRVPAERLGTYILAAKTHRAAGHTDWKKYLYEVADSVETVLSKKTLEPWERLYLAEYYHAIDDPDEAWKLFESASSKVWTDYHIFYYMALAMELEKPLDEGVLKRLAEEPLGPFSRTGSAFVQILWGQSKVALLTAERILAECHSENSATLALDVYQLAGKPEVAKEIAQKRLKRLQLEDLDAWEQWTCENLLRYHAQQFTAEELIERAKTSQYPNKFLGFAHWTIALNHLARNDVISAKEHLRLCVETRGFYLSHCWWARALLAQLDRTDHWPPRGPK